MGVVPVRENSSANISHAALWVAYKKRQNNAVDELIQAYLPLTHRVLERISIRLPSHVAVEDLSQVALVGLYRAIVDFEPERGVPFEAFAYPRIRGSILDELRANDFLSRNKRAQIGRVEKIISAWVKKNDEMPSEEAIANELDISVEEFNQLLDQAKPWCSLDVGNDDDMSLYETIADPNSDSERRAQLHDVQQLLRTGFRQLDMREQKILYLYYFEELRLSEIAALFNLSEARISQIHALSVMRLRAALTETFPSEFAA